MTQGDGRNFGIYPGSFGARNDSFGPFLETVLEAQQKRVPRTIEDRLTEIERILKRLEAKYLDD